MPPQPQAAGQQQGGVEEIYAIEAVAIAAKQAHQRIGAPCVLRQKKSQPHTDFGAAVGLQPPPALQGKRPQQHQQPQQRSHIVLCVAHDNKAQQRMEQRLPRPHGYAQCCHQQPQRPHHIAPRHHCPQKRQGRPHCKQLPGICPCLVGLPDKSQQPAERHIAQQQPRQAQARHGYGAGNGQSQRQAQQRQAHLARLLLPVGSHPKNQPTAQQ